MKKVLVVVAIVILICSYFKDDSIVIPSDAIRFRVIASSNSIEDQTIKNDLSKSLQKEIYNLTSNSKSSSETKDILLKNHEYLDNYINDYLHSKNVSYSYDLKIGKNYYPKKSYKGIEYDAGYYDSINVELGKKAGLNWWCIIYPPLCLIDEDQTDYEYTTLVKEILS